MKGMTFRGVLVILFLGAGLTAGAGIALKVTDQARFCGSCHIMYEAVRTHQMSVHADLDCNECHAPYRAMPKMVFKAYAGTKDVYKNTLGHVGDLIEITPASREVVNDNCINCHARTRLNVAERQAKAYCKDCHRQVPHMNNLPISKRRVADE